MAAVDTAKTLTGVDPTRLVTVGASIGADAATDACGEGCQGALALSPGGYQNVPFAEAVGALDGGDPPRPVWCLATAGDADSAEACRSAEGDLYRSILYPGSDHGMALIQPGKNPDTLGILFEFLELALASD
jgi:hypothetical protein